MALNGQFHFSAYDGAQVPKGYYLRHVETGKWKDRPACRAVALVRDSGWVVGHVEEETDMMTMSHVYTLVFTGNMPLDDKPRYKMRGEDLSELFVRVCAYDRVTT